jgi:acetyl-CoA carboxylase carboxyltransferase component
VEDDRAAVSLVKDLLEYLPQNELAAFVTHPPEPPPTHDPGAVLPLEARGYYDVRDVIRALVDGGVFLEVASRWARNMVVGFARLEGRPLAIVANQPRYLGGIIDVDGSQKGAKFLRTCNAFGIPLLVLVDTPGFMPGTRQESLGVIRHGAELVRAFASSPCPRVTVILRKAFGGAFITMNSKDLGADAAFSWPTAEIGVMSARAAVEIIHGRKLSVLEDARAHADWLARRYAEEHLTAEAAVSRGVIDALIAPTETRRRVFDALMASDAAGWRRPQRHAAIAAASPR